MDVIFTVTKNICSKYVFLKMLEGIMVKRWYEWNVTLLTKKTLSFFNLDGTCKPIFCKILKYASIFSLYRYYICCKFPQICMYFSLLSTPHVQWWLFMIFLILYYFSHFSGPKQIGLTCMPSSNYYNMKLHAGESPFPFAWNLENFLKANTYPEFGKSSTLLDQHSLIQPKTIHNYIT